MFHTIPSFTILWSLQLRLWLTKTTAWLVFLVCEQQSSCASFFFDTSNICKRKQTSTHSRKLLDFMWAAVSSFPKMSRFLRCPLKVKLCLSKAWWILCNYRVFSTSWTTFLVIYSLCSSTLHYASHFQSLCFHASKPSWPNHYENQMLHTDIRYLLLNSL